VPRATTKPASRREVRRLQQQDVSRNQLLDAAEEVFGEKGFHDTTLKEVAELAEFSVGSVYSFFESKDDLFRQIFERRGAEFMPGLKDALGDPKGDPVEQLHALVDFEVGFFRAHPRFGRLYLRYSSAITLSPDRELDMVMQERYEEAMALQAGLFRRGQRAGTLRKGDADARISALPSSPSGRSLGLTCALSDSSPADRHDRTTRSLSRRSASRPRGRRADRLCPTL